jgi:hypothetical protein
LCPLNGRITLGFANVEAYHFFDKDDADGRVSSMRTAGARELPVIDSLDLVDV